VSVFSVVYCDVCHSTASPQPDDLSASEAAAKAGWTQVPTNPENNWTGRSINDVCPTCKNKGGP